MGGRNMSPDQVERTHLFFEGRNNINYARKAGRD